jgi:hypothetical protein
MSDLEQVFKSLEPTKPVKKKRVLTDKQKEALQIGREKRAERIRNKLNNQAEKDMVKEQKEQRKTKKTLIKEQEEVREKQSQNEEEKYINNFKEKISTVKNQVLDKIDDPKVWKSMKTYFNNVKIEKKDDVDLLKDKLLKDLNEIKNKSNNNKNE